MSEPGFPGEYPFTRGIQPTMYRSRLWTMRQYAGFGAASESNVRYKYLLEQGVTGLSIAFDLPTQMGYDSDHPLAEGEVGRVGVAIDTIEDMEADEDTIVLDKTVFANLGAPGELSEEEFAIGANATESDDRVVYNNLTGELFHDGDGVGGGAKTLFAKLDAGLALTNLDIIVVA